MNLQLTTIEIQEFQQLLANDTPAQQALTTLQQHNGNLENTFDALWQEKVGKTSSANTQNHKPRTATTKINNFFPIFLIPAFSSRSW